MRFYVMSTLLVLLLSLGSRAQVSLPSTTGQYTIVLTDSTRLQGRIVRQDSATIVVRLRTGKLTYVHPELFLRIEAGPGASDAPAAPKPGERVIITLDDNTQVRGVLVQQDSTNVVLRQPNGNLTFIPPGQVAYIAPGRSRSVAATPDTGTGPRRRGYDNQFTPYLLIDQTAYNPTRNRGYYRTIWVLYNEIHYGLTNHWSVGASVLPVSPTLYEDRAVPAGVNLSTKLSVPLGPYVRLGVNLAYQPVQRFELFRIDRVVNWQGILSLGKASHNLTMAYGRITNANFAPGSRQYVRLGFVQKLSPGLTVVSDNAFNFRLSTFYSGPTSRLSVALRFDRRYHAFDLGLLGETYNGFFQNGNLTLYPHLGYNLLLGGRR